MPISPTSFVPHELHEDVYKKADYQNSTGEEDCRQVLYAPVGQDRPEHKPRLLRKC